VIEEQQLRDRQRFDALAAAQLAEQCGQSGARTETGR
jgi:hypothetical protein